MSVTFNLLLHERRWEDLNNIHERYVRALRALGLVQVREATP